MKGRNIYIICLVIAFFLLAKVYLNAPPKFIWNPSYQHNDHQPLGCFVFDSLMTSTLPDGYALTPKSLWQLDNDSAFDGNILLHAIPDEGFSINENSLLSLLRKGHNVCIAVHSLSHEMNDSLRLEPRRHFFISSLFNNLTQTQRQGVIRWKKQPGMYTRNEYPMYSQLCFETDNPDYKTDTLSSKWEVLASFSDDNGEAPAVISRRFGKGKLIICYTPMLMTNYGMLDGRTAEYVMRILSQLGKGKLIRTTSYCLQDKEEEETSPLRYFLQHPPLKWAIWLTVLTLLAFMLFSIRRQQRPIPLPQKYVNRQLEFVKHIGTLYAERLDPLDLLCKRFVYFAEFLRREVQIDICDESEDESNFARLSMLTGKPLQDFSFIKHVRRMSSESPLVTVDSMKIYIDKMEEIENEIKQT